MKKMLLFILMVLVSLSFFNCGPGKLTSEKAKVIIDEELDSITKQFLDSVGTALTEPEKEKALKNIEKLKQNIQVTGVKQEKESTIAKVEVKIEKQAITTDVKFNKYDTGWKIDEIKAPTGEWIPLSAVLNFLKGSMASVMLGKGKIKATMGDMKTMGAAIEDYMTDMYEAPQVDSVQGLKEKLQPFYIKTLPLKDAWGNEFYYYHGTGENKDTYAIGSAGSDGKFEGFDQKGTYTDYKGKDIIFSNGMFTFYPKVK